MIERFVLITGAAQRIGRAISLALGQAGCAVALHYNKSEAEIQDVRDQLTMFGVRTCLVQADLSDAAAVETIISQASDGLGEHLNMLINNASAFEYDNWIEWTTSDWDKQMAINLRAPCQLMQSFALQAIGEDPLIINMIDQRVWSLSPDFMSYTLSKAALWTATQTASQGLAPYVRVNGIGPGPILRSHHQTEAEFNLQCQLTPLGRGASTDEIVNAIQFIERTPSMTGQMIALDGGEHLEWRRQVTGDTPL